MVLSIDSELQAMAENAFLGRAGSVVAMEVNTGFILALASFPDYDPNLLHSKERGSLVRSLNTNLDKPWINKAVQTLRSGQYIQSDNCGERFAKQEGRPLDEPILIRILPTRTLKMALFFSPGGTVTSL